MYNCVFKNCASLLAAFFLLSCNKDIVYNDFRPVPDKKWDKSYGFVFEFDLKDASIPYDITLQLRNSVYYPYQNLWILFDQFHQDEILCKDTIEYRLVNDFGRWTGNGITLYQNQFPLRSNYHFPDTGTYTITIRHGMIDARLKGIENVGLLIRTSK